MKCHVKRIAKKRYYVFMLAVTLTACGQSQQPVEETILARHVYSEPRTVETPPGSRLEKLRFRLDHVDDAANGVAFIDSSVTLAVATNQDVIMLNASDGSQIRRFEACTSCSVVHIEAASNGQEILLPGRARNSGAAYDPATGTKTRDLEGPDYRAAYSPDGAVVLAVQDGEAVLETADTAAVVWQSGKRDVAKVAYAPDGGFFVIAAAMPSEQGKGGSVYVYTATDRTIDTQIKYERATFNHVAITADSSRLVLGSYIGRVLVWDLTDAKVACRFDSAERRVGLRALKVSPDGRWIATGGGTDQSGYVRIWSSDDCALRAQFELPNRASGLSFHPNLAVLAAGAWGGEVLIIDTIGLYGIDATSIRM